MALFWLWLISQLLPEKDWGAHGGFSGLAKINCYVEAAESHASSEWQRLGSRQTDRLPQAPDNQGSYWATTALQDLKILREKKIKKKKKAFICWTLSLIMSKTKKTLLQSSWRNILQQNMRYYYNNFLSITIICCSHYWYLTNDNYISIKNRMVL